MRGSPAAACWRPEPSGRAAGPPRRRRHLGSHRGRSCRRRKERARPTPRGIAGCPARSPGRRDEAPSLGGTSRPPNGVAGDTPTPPSPLSHTPHWLSSHPSLFPEQPGGLSVLQWDHGVSLQGTSCRRGMQGLRRGGPVGHEPCVCPRARRTVRGDGARWPRPARRPPEPGWREALARGPRESSGPQPHVTGTFPDGVGQVLSLLSRVPCQRREAARVTLRPAGQGHRGRGRPAHPLGPGRGLGPRTSLFAEGPEPSPPPPPREAAP